MSVATGDAPGHPRLLLVSYCFPPDYSVGGKRAQRIADHLAGLGWEVETLTVRETYYERCDPTLAAGTGPYRTIRTRALLPKPGIRRLRSALGLAGGAPTAHAPGSPGSSAGGWDERVSALWDRFVSIPDEWIGWFPAAVLRGRGAARRADVVLATAPPFTGFLVAAALARRESPPLVLDYRDPWMTLRGEETSPAWRLRLERWLEHRCLERASRVITTTHAIARSLDRPGAPPVTVIPNGFDATLMRDIAPHRFQRFTILYAGNLYGDRSARPILGALRRLRESARIPSRGLSLRVVGPSTQEVIALADRMEVRPLVEVEDFLPHREALSRMRGADLLLLLVPPEHAGLVPAKLFEYLMARRFILAIAPDRSEAARIVRDTRSGAVVAPDDEEAIAAAIALRYEATGEDLPPHPSLREYDATTTMRALDRMLRDLVAESASGRPRPR